jgi:hypothetical protein
MERLRTLLITVAVFLFANPIFGQTDSTIRVKHTISMIPARADEENPSIIRSVYYLHPSARRIDSLDTDGKITFIKINNCASRSGIIADPRSREYRSLKLPRPMTEQQLRDYIDKHPADAVRIEIRTVDTGEKKILFGLTAKHFVTTIERPVKNGVSGSEKIDGWYVDHEQLECEKGDALPAELRGQILTNFPEIPDTHHMGPIPPGLPLQVTDTIKWKGGKHGTSGETMKSEVIVESISDSPLDTKTFEIPVGFRENSGLLR